MTASGEDILAWVDNAISGREKTAREAEAISPSPWTAGPNEDESVAHMAAHDPASVLRRCVADRKLIAEHGPWSDTDRSCKGCGFDNQGGSMVVDYRDCPALNGIAEGYGWTGGER